MEPADLVFAGVARLAELVRDGEVTPRELVDACLERIERLDPVLNAFRVVMAGEARAEADAMAGGSPRGPLHGIPVAVKDDMDVAGQVTGFGSDPRRPPATEDAELVRRLRAAGAIVIGKTNVPELTMWGFTESAARGTTRNPWDLGRAPGGSSGGSAAAVAAGLVPLATASDGSGSIRIPASYCGLVGLKPRRGRISLGPKEEAWHGLVHYGVLTRRVLDTALVLDAVAADPPERLFADAVEAAAAPSGLRIGVSLAIPPGLFSRVSPAVRDAVEAVGETLGALGHRVFAHDPPFEMDVLRDGVVARYFRGIHDDAVAMGGAPPLERRTRSMVRIGGLIPKRVIERSRAGEAAEIDRLNRELFGRVDALLQPTTATAAIRAGRFEGRGAIFTWTQEVAAVPHPGPWNFYGHPAISIPAGFTTGGLPLGAMLVAPDEATVLALAAQLEAERRWADRRPPIS